MCCKILCCKFIDCSSCFYGSHEFAYADELTLASLLTDLKTKYFDEDPTSDDSRALLLKKFGAKFSPADCVKKVQYLQTELKTNNLCISQNFTTDASATPKNTMSDGLHSARGAEIGLDASASQLRLGELS